MRELGRHRYHPRDVVGRWTVIRHASPVQRPHGNNRTVWRHRVEVRCVCGDSDVVLERVLTKGRSRGCSSRTCMHAHRTRQDIEFWDRLRTEAESLRKQADEAEQRAAGAELRIAQAKEKLAGLCSKLEARWR
jgi:hypothetical protein